MHLRLFIAAALGLALSLITGRASAGQVTVYAAASFSAVLEEVLAAHGQSIIGTTSFRASYAASSTLAQQISNGAPADIYISANQQWGQFLEDKGFIVAGQTRLITSNRLTVIVPKTHNTERIRSLRDLPRLLDDGRLAVGNPAHVPAGLYAKAALQATGQWQKLRNRLIPAANVRAALRFVETGEAPAGIVYASDAWLNTNVKVVLPIPVGLHPKIEYVAAMVRGRDKPEVERLMEFLQGSRASAIYVRHGFSLD